jgi:hypothetical protein
MPVTHDSQIPLNTMFFIDSTEEYEITMSRVILDENFEEKFFLKYVETYDYGVFGESLGVLGNVSTLWNSYGSLTDSYTKINNAQNNGTISSQQAAQMRMDIFGVEVATVASKFALGAATKAAAAKVILISNPIGLAAGMIIVVGGSLVGDRIINWANNQLTNMILGRAIGGIDVSRVEIEIPGFGRIRVPNGYDPFDVRKIISFVVQGDNRNILSPNFGDFFGGQVFVFGMPYITWTSPSSGELRRIRSIDFGGTPPSRGKLTGALDVSRLTALESINISRHSITSLNASGCTSLRILNAWDNQLTSLNVSGCASLESIGIYDNQLTSIDVSGLISLRTLNAPRNQLTSINISNTPSLENLYLNSNQFITLNVSGHTSLYNLFVHENPLTSINASGCTSLWRFSIGSLASEQLPQLAELDLSECTSLWALTVINSPLTSLNISGCTSLEMITIRNSSLVSLDVSGLTTLDQLSIRDNNYLMSLDVSGCTSLRYIWASNSQLTTINVSELSMLRELDANTNRLTDISAFENLESLTHFDVRNNFLNLNAPEIISSIKIIEEIISRNRRFGFPQVHPQRTPIECIDHIAGANATCTTPQICMICFVIITPATGHTAGALATCTTSQNCTICDLKIVEVLGHEWSSWVQVGDTDTYTRTCRRIGCDAEDTLIPTGGDPTCDHNFSGTVMEIKAATCTTAGLEFKKCTHCNFEQTQAITALGHSFGAWGDNTATCMAAGIETRTCTRTCGETGHTETQATTPLNHDMPVIWTERTAPTCMVDGLEYRRCSRFSVCGHEVTQPKNAIGHSFSAWGGNTATCTAAGFETRTCIRACGETGHTETQATTSLNHDIPVIWTERTPPNCGIAGLEFKKCSRCDHEETQPITTLTHRWVTNANGTHNCTTVNGCNATNETCSPNGVGDECIKCHYITPDPTCLHANTTTAYDPTPTCISGGASVVTCDDCHGTISSGAVEALNHAMPTAWTVRIPAICGTAGVEYRTCTRNNCDHEEVQTILALIHSWGAWTVTTPATATTDGVETRTCTLCNEPETRPIPATGNGGGAITPPNNDGGTTTPPNNDTTNPPVIDDSFIAEILKQDNPIIDLSQLDGMVIIAEDLQRIKASGKDVTVILENGFSFKIIANSISNEAKAFDLNIVVELTSRATEIDGVKIPVNAIIITPNFSGEFGFEIAFTFTAEQLTAAGINGNNVKLFHIDHDRNVTDMGRARLNADGSVEIVISHASFYVLSEQVPTVDEAPTSEDESDTTVTTPPTNTEDGNPTTGVTLGMTAVILAGNVAVFSRKRKKCNSATRN